MINLAGETIDARSVDCIYIYTCICMIDSRIQRRETRVDCLFDLIACTSFLPKAPGSGNLCNGHNLTYLACYRTHLMYLVGSSDLPTSHMNHTLAVVSVVLRHLQHSIPIIHKYFPVMSG
jgi:hypothetical protein